MVALSSHSQRRHWAEPDSSTTLASFRNKHEGSTIIVCGCGESLKELTQPERFITIGVNDVGRQFQPDYLVVVNPRSQFSGDRFHYVETSGADYLFTQLDLGVVHPKVVRFRLGAYGGTDLSRPDVLHYTQNSPYVALCLAIHLGARRIGLIGVDFTEHHFFARTGKHMLSARLEQVDREYALLAQACREKGVEVVNLSPRSLLTAFPKSTFKNWTEQQPIQSTDEGGKMRNRRIFFVNYRFLSCGEVFSDGLRNAADELGLLQADAYWDDPELPAKIRNFNPDLLFVVHGRKFVQRWRETFRSYQSAVWLTDEPYEVDDTAQWSGHFGTVFINDPNSLNRHKNAHYLPVAFDPKVHCEIPAAKNYATGFIGGYNQTRENYLIRLADEGLLSYVIGGPWKSPVVRQLCLADNISANATAEFYKQSRIVINVFRETHHFNRLRIPAYSLNPRIYEALACGAMVVSEKRAEVEALFPEIPVFESGDGLVEAVRSLLSDDEARQSCLSACRQRLGAHTYQQRLQTVLAICLDKPNQRNEQGKAMETIELRTASQQPAHTTPAANLPPGWIACGNRVVKAESGELVLAKPHDNTPGSEQGLASVEAFGAVELTFEMQLSEDAIFLAKIHQVDCFDQSTNSYHLCCGSGRAYLAMHHRILSEVSLTPHGGWVSIKIGWRDGLLTLARDGVQIVAIREQALPSGYCFLGIKGGRARLRNLSLTVPASLPSRPGEQPATHALNGWRQCGVGLHTNLDGVVTLSGETGVETGLASEMALTQAELSFELKLDTDATFIAKIHNQDRNDPATNSYHLICAPKYDYLAKHNTVFQTLLIQRGIWQSIVLRRTEHARLELIVNDAPVANILDNQLQSGFCFLGVGQGRAELRNIRLRDLANPSPDDKIVQPDNGPGLRGTQHFTSDGGLKSQDFTQMPRRNLLYHIWPVNGSMWQWNLEQLKQRIDIFNGRRLIGIVYDERSAPPEAVMEALDGNGCEFIVRPNDATGEVITFTEMLREVASQDPSEISFYGHAKGVKYGAGVSEPIRLWTEALYRTTLDNWLEVKRQLQRCPLTGSFRMLGRFRTHHNLGDWHYSGTFFWMRHSLVFSRKCLDIPQFYGGVEAWPGIHFSQCETGCLFLDQLRQLPYHKEFWTSRANTSLRQWETGRQGVLPAPDLVNPVPFEGHAWPRVEQKPEELDWWIQTLLESGVRRLLTIGAMHGGVEWHLARIFREHGRDIKITTVDIAPGPEAYRAFEDATQRFGQGMRLIAQDSSSESLKTQLDESYDAVFIDGDHSYRGVKSDWQLAQTLKPKLVGFHDIVDSDWHIQCRCCVSRLWDEIKTGHVTDERTTGVWGGIGIVRL